MNKKVICLTLLLNWTSIVINMMIEMIYKPEFQSITLTLIFGKISMIEIGLENYNYFMKCQNLI